MHSIVHSLKMSRWLLSHPLLRLPSFPWSCGLCSCAPGSTCWNGFCSTPTLCFSGQRHRGSAPLGFWTPPRRGPCIAGLCKLHVQIKVLNLGWDPCLTDEWPTEWWVLHSRSFSQLPSLHVGRSADGEWEANIQKAQWKRGEGAKGVAHPQTRN